jgi:crotonobetaine/carnitine-CoA ligase
MQHVIGSVGTPLQWFEVQIVGPDGKALGCGEAGEIVVTPRVPGPIFAGYVRNPEASARSLRDGRLHTGDLGQLDEENNLFFLGRQSDSVRHKGENVSAWEVESVANKHEHVASSAMIGVPGELGEQDIMLFVQPAEGVDFDVPAFARWLAGELASYQMPRYIQLVVEFERTPSERIMKHKLQADPHQCWDRQSRRSALSN